MLDPGACPSPPEPEPYAGNVPRSARVSILDLDRTLTRNGTYTPFLLQAAWTLAPWRLSLVPVVLTCMAAYKLRLISRKRLKELMHRALIGPRSGRTEIATVARRFAQRLDRTNIYPAARALIEHERSNGQILIMATAAHRFYAAAIANQLGIEHVVATESAWIDNELTPILGTNCHSRDKLSRLSEYLQQNGIERQACHCRFYSDDHSDLPTFEWCDEPIVVNPSLRLRRLASDRGWRVLRW